MENIEPVSKQQRKIIHVDMDCYYAAIEVRDDPSLKGHPVAVGGDPSRRGVIATCNYEARAYGIHSAMSSAQAKRVCPGLLIVPGNFDKYRHDSKVIRKIFSQYTDLVEPLSLDEAFLDVSDCKQYKGSATYIAQAIRYDIYKALSLTASAGIAPNKFLAKIASDWNKPNGQFVITPDEVDEFVKQLDVKKIPGVGKKTTQKLNNLGIYTCSDIRECDLLTLSRQFGSYGDRLHKLAHGIDEREVIVSYPRKSLSVENTYEHDLSDLESCIGELPKLLLDLKRRIGKSQVNAPINKQFVKVKFSDFTATTVERTSFGINDDLFFELLEEGFNRRAKPARLLGVGVRFQVAESTSFVQLPLEYQDLEADPTDN